MGGGEQGDVSRRALLLRAGGLGLAATWAPAFRVTSALAQDACTPARLPPGVEVYRQAFRNWSGEVAVDDVWTCAPAKAQDVAALANWARREGWRLRPRGRMHTWGPLVITTRDPCQERTLLVDLTQHFAGIELLSGERVRVGAGAILETLLTRLEEAGLGMTGVPATGDLTIGGALAIGAHGASLPALGERRPRGHTYGSLSNLVLSLDAVVWDRKRKRYAIRTFDRSHPACSAFLTSLGRAFLTDVTLRVGPNARVRCESIIDIPGAELFAAPGRAGPRRFTDFLDKTGRVESIWFPFTESPWLKVWSVAPEKPASSREVTAPYNYPFSDSVPLEAAELADQIITGNEGVTPLFGQTMYDVVQAGLPATESQDIWGWSRNTLFYIRASTLRVAELGLAILTSRRNVQAVLSELAAYWRNRLDDLAAQGSYPMNMPLEMRVSGLDRPSHVGRRRAQAPALAATRPRPDRRDWDVVIWVNPLTFPATRGSWSFYADFESFCRRRYAGGDALHRQEWSKGWAYTAGGPCTSTPAMRGWVRDGWRRGYRDEGWDRAASKLRSYDPHEIFTNSFTRELFARRG